MREPSAGDGGGTRVYPFLSHRFAIPSLRVPWPGGELSEPLTGGLFALSSRLDTTVAAPESLTGRPGSVGARGFPAVTRTRDPGNGFRVNVRLRKARKCYGMGAIVPLSTSRRAVSLDGANTSTWYLAPG
jgi:hypothetical protein